MGTKTVHSVFFFLTKCRNLSFPYTQGLGDRVGEGEGKGERDWGEGEIVTRKFVCYVKGSAMITQKL